MRTCLAAAGGSLLAATIGLFGAASFGQRQHGSPVVGYTYVDGNTATANTIEDPYGPDGYRGLISGTCDGCTAEQLAGDVS